MAVSAGISTLPLPTVGLEAADPMTRAGLSDSEIRQPRECARGLVDRLAIVFPPHRHQRIVRLVSHPNSSPEGT